MLVFIAMIISRLNACSVANNDPVTDINPDCNYAGKCASYGPFTFCSCCTVDNWCSDHWQCDPQNPTYQCIQFIGTGCTDVDQYFFANFGFRVLTLDESQPADVICYTDPQERAQSNTFNSSNVLFQAQVNYIAKDKGWPGTVWQSILCDTCTPAYPCVVGVDQDKNVTTGYNFGFQAAFGEYYSSDCGTDSLVYYASQLPDCDANYDYGQVAFREWMLVRGDIEDEDVTFLNAVNDLLRAEPDDSNVNLGLGWVNSYIFAMSEQITKVKVQEVYNTLAPTPKPTRYPTVRPTLYPTPSPTTVPTPSPTYSPTEYPTLSPTEIPTNSPTETPTSYPTDMPTQSPTSGCGPYTNNVNDLDFQGVGSDCRSGLNSSWPGGLTCESPYVVCLPQENTPATFGGQPYKSSTHRYSVDECLQECANDQRCLGVEFMADSNSALGDCNLIDDIPVEITSQVDGFNYDPAAAYGNLDTSVTGGTALCFTKNDDCYPYFEASDLNDVMLNCYCPNNRKGFYTKKVKRTVTNTRFCGSDSDVDLRIMKAQANRMFHLCENWCLFNTDDPEAETWYWDPWKMCWREQYAGVGNHMSYCNRVIRSPDTIEMQFINHRTNFFCETATPTASPSVMDSTWFMADEEDSCDDVCIANNMVCDENLVASVEDPTPQSEVYFTAAGISCASIMTGEVDWALPGYETSTGACLTRNNATENTGCNWALGVGYKRLCACVSGQ